MTFMRSNEAVPVIRVRNQPPMNKAAVETRHLARILKLRVIPDDPGLRVQATVYGIDGMREITWRTRQRHVEVQAGQLVHTWGAGTPYVQSDGYTAVMRVVPLLQVDPDVYLLDTVPASWLPLASDLAGKRVAATAAFRQLWECLTRPMRAWFNALFWYHPKRLYRFLLGPASMKHHHARKHGLYIHSVDCALRALEAAQHDRLVDMEVLLMAALLHDVGKAEEYQWIDSRQQWQLSERGALMGHRLSTLEWMASARGALSVEDAPDADRVMAVYHAIHACHAPDWVGLRSPRTPEAFYLASVDGLSGHCDLIETHAQPNHSWGRYHHAFRGGAFVQVGAARMGG